MCLPFSHQSSVIITVPFQFLRNKTTSCVGSTRISDESWRKHRIRTKATPQRHFAIYNFKYFSLLPLSYSISDVLLPPLTTVKKIAWCVNRRRFVFVRGSIHWHDDELALSSILTARFCSTLMFSLSFYFLLVFILSFLPASEPEFWKLFVDFAFL